MMLRYKKSLVAIFCIVAGLTPFLAFGAINQQEIEALLERVNKFQKQLDALTGKTSATINLDNLPPANLYTPPSGAGQNTASNDNTGSANQNSNTSAGSQNPFSSAAVYAVKGKFSANDEVTTTSRLNVRSESSVSGRLIQAVPSGSRGTVVGGPIAKDGYIWWKISYAKVSGWSAENWLTKSELYGARPGTLRIRATVDGSPWTGSFVVAFSYPELSSDGSVISTGNYPNLPPGDYSFTYKSGGPKQAAFLDVTPSGIQTLTSSTTRTFTFNFISTE